MVANIADCRLSSWQSNHVVGQFKLRHPEVYGIDDAAGIMFGRIGKVIVRIVFFLCEFPTQALMFSSDSANVHVFRLGLRLRLRYVESFNRSECGVRTWYLHSNIRGRRCCNNLYPDLNSHPVESELACCRWSCYHSYLK